MTLQLKKISYSYGQTLAVQDVSCSIKQGEILVLLGPSGCGKTTLLRLISGVFEPSAGSVSFKGQSLSGCPIEDRHIAYLMEDWALYPHMTVKTNLAFPLRVRRWSKEKQKSRIASISKRLGIEHLLDRFPANLSAGQKQRVSLGRGLVRDDVQILLADEPFSSVDPILRHSLRQQFVELCREHHVATVIVSHDQMDAVIADRVAVMKDGIIYQTGSLQELYLDPNHLFVSQFIGPIPANELHQKFVPRLASQLSDCVFTIRPEHIEMLSEYEGARICGTVLSTKQFPPLCWVEVQVDSTIISVSVSGLLPEVGSKIGLDWCDSKVQVFDGLSGKRARTNA